MKQKLVIIIALALLLAVVIFMAWDMFYHKPGNEANPYDFNMKSLRTGDTSVIMYEEAFHFTSGLAAIHGIAVDQNDRIYISGENGLEVYDPNGKKETGFSIRGTSTCVHVDRAGRIYLGMADHVEIYDLSGKQRANWRSPGDKTIITSIAVNSGNVYLADAGSKVVLRCDLVGNLLNRIGEKDPAKNIPGFVVPSPYFDLALGPGGELWVVNPGRHHFEKYDSEGNLSATWGISSMSMEGFCGCCNPSHFAMFPDGSFVTSEKAIERIKVYGPTGEFKFVVAGPGSFIEGTRGLDLAVDSKGRILVLDPEKKQVRVFVLRNESKH
jgi:sugar lactone lactonase YvrE